MALVTAAELLANAIPCSIEFVKSVAEWTSCGRVGPSPAPPPKADPKPCRTGCTYVPPSALINGTLYTAVCPECYPEADPRARVAAMKAVAEEHERLNRHLFPPVPPLGSDEPEADNPVEVVG